MLLTTSEPWPTPSPFLQLVKVLPAQSCLTLCDRLPSSLLWWKVPSNWMCSRKWACPSPALLRVSLSPWKGQVTSISHSWQSSIKQRLLLTEKKIHKLNIESSVLFSRREALSPGGTEGLLWRGKGGARIYRSFCKTKQTNKSPRKSNHQKIS